MCYPKPGPRCAAHTRETMITSRLALRAAHEHLESLTSTNDDSWVNEDTADSREEALASVCVAKARYDQSRREYETTPEGQVALQQIISQMREDGLDEEAEIAQRRLLQVRTVRQSQIADHKESLRYAENLNRILTCDGGAQQAMQMDEHHLNVLKNVSAAAEQEARRQNTRSGRELSTNVDSLDVSLTARKARTEYEAQAHLNCVQRAAYAHGFSGPGMSLDITQPGALAGKMFLNPDGTYNIVKHSAPSAGFPDGRMTPVISLEFHGTDRSQVRAVKFADGTQQFMTGRTLQERAAGAGQVAGLRLVPPSENAQPFDDFASRQVGNLFKDSPLSTEPVGSNRWPILAA